MFLAEQLSNLIFMNSRLDQTLYWIKHYLKIHMIVKIVKEDNSTSKKSLVKKKIQDDVKSEKKVSEFITSVDPNSNK